MNHPNTQVETDLQLAGIEALNQALGIAGALKFLRLFNREPTDYVEISRRLYQHQRLDDIFARAKSREVLPIK